MPVTSKLKNKIDLPVWEWARPALSTPSTGNTTCVDPTSASRYIYYLNNANNSAGGFSRYDTITDSWQALSNTINNFANNATTMTYSKWHGHYGRVISAGTGSNTLELAALQGNALVGYKIRIIAGRGAGQERTITAVSDPIVRDRGLVSTASNTQIIGDTAGVGVKQWRVNQWRDYQVRAIYGSTAGALVRPILYNNYNTLTFSDPAWASITPWWGPTSPTATAIPGTTPTTIFQIESNIITVNSNWTTAPDATSQFVILSDGIWYINSSTGNAFYTINYYDVIADIWYNKTSTASVFTAQMGIDACSEKFLEYPTYLLVDTASSATDNTLTDTSLALCANQYANYAVSILSGTGIGQYRSVVANNSNTFFIGKKWNVTPDSTSQFVIHRDVNNFFWNGGGLAAIFQYDVDSDQSVISKIYDNGVARTVAVSGAGFEPLAVTSITRATGGATAIAIATAGSGYAVDTIITFTGGASVRVTGINSTGGITSISIENFGSGYAGGNAAMTISSTTPALPTGGTAATFTNTTASVVGTVATVASHPFKMGDIVTITGDTAASPNFNNTYTIISNNAVTGFGFIASAAQNATVPAQGTTSLVDVTKSWTTNELVGKLVQITSGASPNPTVQIRKITSNTATTINWVGTATAATNSTSRYVIIDEKAFATEQSYAVAAAGGKSGVATSGTSSSLTDTTKNWPINYWTDTRPTGASNTARRVKIIAGTGNGAEMVITSNTANTLNFASQAFTVDNTTVYQIMECFGQATGGTSTSLIDTTQNWATNSMVGKRVRMVAGSSTTNEATVTANTQTTLTFSTVTAPDTTTSYSIIEPTTRGSGSSMFILRNSTNSNLNNRFLYMFRGAATAELGRYNTRTEIFEPITFFPFTETLTTGTSYAYDGVDRIYFQKDATGRCYYYDVAENMVYNSSTTPYSQGTAAIGNRMEIVTTEDNLKYLYVIRNGGQEFWRTLLFW